MSQFSKYPDYKELLEHVGLTVLGARTVGVWQGDYVYLVQDVAERLGVAVIGYGSCSGCDTLYSILDYATTDKRDEGLKTLAAQVRDEVRWETSPAALRELFRQHDPNYWYSYDTGVRGAVEEMTLEYENK